MTVYLIGESEKGPLKIGRSFSPQERLSQLQCGNPKELFLFAEMGWCGSNDYDPYLEKFLHEELSDFHIRGEWFSVSLEHMEFCFKDNDPETLFIKHF